jgi:hypothetical protein
MYLQIAQLCIKAVTDTALISRWIDVVLSGPSTRSQSASIRAQRRRRG